MTCQEQIDSLQKALDAIDARLSQLKGMPGSDTDPAIQAAIQQLEAQRTAVAMQLENIKASCTDSTPMLSEARAAAAKTAVMAIKRSHAAHVKSAISGSDTLVKHSEDLLKAVTKKPR